MSRCPAAAKMPAVTSSESPGRKKPIIRPVSAKTMTTSMSSPPQRMIPSTS